MKTLILLLALTSLTAQAEISVSGTFGLQYITNKSSPSPISAQDAEEIYYSLDLDGGRKIIKSADKSFLTCDVNECHFIIKEGQKFNIIVNTLFEKTVTFSGDLAEKIFNTLYDTTLIPGRRVPLKKVANLTCSRPDLSGKKTTCTIVRTTAIEVMK